MQHRYLERVGWEDLASYNSAIESIIAEGNAHKKVKIIPRKIDIKIGISLIPFLFAR